MVNGKHKNIPLCGSLKNKKRNYFVCQVSRIRVLLAQWFSENSVIFSCIKLHKSGIFYKDEIRKNSSNKGLIDLSEFKVTIKDLEIFSS
jgi:hypothetical protein